MRRRVVLAGLAAPLPWPAVALGHAVLVKSVPAQRAALVEPPPRVEPWFNERLEPAYPEGPVTNERRDAGRSAWDGRECRREIPGGSRVAAGAGAGSLHRELSMLCSLVDGHVVVSRS